MREHISAALRVFAAAICDAAICSLFLSLVLTLYDVPHHVQLAVGIWAGGLLAQTAVSRVLSARRASWLIYVLAQAACLIFIERAVLAQTVFTPAGEGFNIFLGVLIAISALHNAYCAIEPPDSGLFVRYIDALLLGIAGLQAVAFGMGKSLDGAILPFALCALALAVAMAASLRAGGESESVVRGAGLGALLVMTGLVLLCLLLTAGLLSLAGGRVESLVALLMAVWAAITRAGGALLDWFERLVLLFSGRRTTIRYRSEDTAAAVSMDYEIAEMGTAPEWVVTAFFILMGLLLLFALGAILWALSRIKMPAKEQRAARRRVVRKSHLLDALKALWRRIADGAAFELAYRFGRRTPQHLLVLAQRRCRRRGLARRPSESGGAYLRRLHGVLSAQGEASTLDRLAAQLDAVLYGGKESEIPREQYRAYAGEIRRIRKAV